MNLAMNRVASDFYKEYFYEEGCFKGRFNIIRVLSTFDVIGITAAVAKTIIDGHGGFFHNAQQSLDAMSTYVFLPLIYSYVLKDMLKETPEPSVLTEKTLEKSQEITAKPLRVERQNCELVCMVALTALGMYGCRYYEMPVGRISHFALSGLALGAAVSYITNSLLTDTPSKDLAALERKSG